MSGAIPHEYGRAAVIGGGPSGFYAADQLLKAGFGVDVLEALPTPFGLVRAGVAPDHPKIKSVTRVYETTANHPGFRLFGGVRFGRDVSRRELRERYCAVVYATGALSAQRLDIPGEERTGSHPATDFVGWYNGHPDFTLRSFDLSCERAVVVGNGNVALDLARMLVQDPAGLAATDIADHALDALRRARIREVVVLGRRGPAQAAFTTPELRALGDLAGVDVLVDAADLELDEHSAAWLAECGDANARQNLQVLREYAARAPRGHDRRIHLRFRCAPLALDGDQPDGPVTGMRIARTAICRDADGRLCATRTDAEEVIDCGLVLRSIGYRGQALPGVPFDADRGVIPNDAGRVLTEDGRAVVGEYVVGWIKRGPSGVIGTNKRDAAETVAKVLEDAEAGRLGPTVHQDASVERWLRSRAPALVTWAGWRAIDDHETSLGARHGRPRVKLVDRAALLTVAATTAGATR